MTWFNNQMKDIIWIDINYNKIQETINKIINEIEKATSKQLLILILYINQY